MRDSENVEEILARLMPAALGVESTRGIEDELDALAARDISTAGRFGKVVRWIGASAGVAAIFCLALFFVPERASSPVAGHVAANAPVNRLEVVRSAELVRSVSDEGWKEQEDGTAVHALRLNVVGEKVLRDAETGIVVKVSQPREEWILTPVTSF